MLKDIDVWVALILAGGLFMMIIGYYGWFWGREKPDYARVQRQKISHGIGRQLMLISYLAPRRAKWNPEVL
jgi:hypothetical protein